jgi:transposase
MNSDPRNARIIELEEKVKELEALIVELRKEIAEKDRIIEEWKRGHRARPRRGGKKKKPGSRKKPGRKIGHEAASRPLPDKIDTEVERIKDAGDCNCGHGVLEPTGNKKEVIIENVIPARVEVEKNILFEYLCTHCGQIHWSKLPPEYGDEPLPGQSKLGPGALDIALALRYDVGTSFHKIAKYLGEHVGLKITASGVYQLLERTASRTAPVSQEILERAQMSAYINMDETTWWEDGLKQWAWIIANLDLSYFHIDPSRAHGVIEKLLCELDEDGNVIAPYEGTVVSDFMGAYRTCEWMVHQFCWAHLLCDAKKAVEMAPDAHSHKFCDELHDIYADALVAQSTGDPVRQQDIRDRFDRLIADTEIRKHADVARLQDRCYLEFDCLLHFMGDPQIPSHNNGGELAARALVLLRKIVFGTRSNRGTEVHSHFMSTSQTAHKQNINHGEFIRKALAAYHSGQPMPSIFDS